MRHDVVSHDTGPICSDPEDPYRQAFPLPGCTVILLLLLLLSNGSGNEVSGVSMLLSVVVAAQPIGAPAWVSPYDYPVRALSEERSGETGVSLRVSEEGKLLSCEISSSSGSQDLDSKTCALITRRARFEPARGGDGRALPSIYRNKISWWTGNGRPPPTVPMADVVLSVEKLAAALERPARLDVAFLVAPDGSLSDCTPGPPEAAAKPRSKQGKAQRAAVELLGAAACPHAAAVKLPPFVNDAGQAVPSIQVVNVIFIEGAPR